MRMRRRLWLILGAEGAATAALCALLLALAPRVFERVRRHYGCIPWE